MLMNESPYLGDRHFNSERKVAPTAMAVNGNHMFMTPPKKENHSVRFLDSVNNSDVKNYSAGSNKRIKLL
jgi:hypothetical protein